MDNELTRSIHLVKAIIIQHIKDTVLPFGELNNRNTCKDAYDFLFNEQSDYFQGFCNWCDLADISIEYWQQVALMNLAYELNFKPWLRNRVAAFMKGAKNWEMLRKYYVHCCEKEYKNFIEEIENV